MASIAYIFPIVLCCCTQIVMYVFNGLSNTNIGGIFINNTADISDVWFSNITPSGTTFTLWGVIYAWQVLFLGYSLSTLCRQGIDGPLCQSPGLLPPSLFYIYAFNNCANVAWLLLWDRSVKSTDFLIASCCVLAVIPVTLYITLAISCYYLDKHATELKKHGLGKEIWLVQFLVQNAFGIYATWTTIAFVLNLGSNITYVSGLEMETTSLIQLGILSAIIAVWFFVDLLALDRYTRFLFTPHLVLVWAFTGVFDENYFDGEGEAHAIFIAVLLGVACAALLTKIIVMAYRGAKQPLYANAVILPTTAEEGKANEAYHSNTHM